MDTSDQQLENIEDIENVKLYVMLSSMLKMSFKLILPLIIPYFGNIFDFFGVLSVPNMGWFRDYTRALIKARRGEKSGRKSDFMNIMLDHQIPEKGSETATKVRLQILQEG